MRSLNVFTKTGIGYSNRHGNTNSNCKCNESCYVVRAEDPWNLLTIATIILAYAIVFLVIITYRGNKQTNKNTQESNTRLELELKARIF